MTHRDLREERQRRRIEGNRKFILQGAEKIFAKKGYGSTSMDDIAREAQFSKATLYRYYGSKSEIFTAVIVASLQEALEAFRRIQGQSIGAEDKLRELIRYVLSYYQEKENIARIFLMERNAMKKALNLDIHHHVMPGVGSEKIPEEFKALITAFHGTMCDIIREGMTAGDFRGMPPEEAGYVLGALLRGFHFRGFLLDKTYSVEESTELLHSFFMNGLKSVPGTRKGESA
jgi:AcrR family transcriptional regulator